MSDVKTKFEPGVITGDKVQELFAFAKANEFAIPAANVTGSNTINAVLETAREVNHEKLAFCYDSHCLYFIHWINRCQGGEHNEINIPEL